MQYGYKDIKPEVTQQPHVAVPCLSLGSELWGRAEGGVVDGVQAQEGAALGLPADRVSKQMEFQELSLSLSPTLPQL